jgi:hypothetical protein
MSTASRGAWSLGVALAIGCGQGDLPGNYFDVALTGSENLCTGGGADYAEKLTYRVEWAGNDVTLAVDDDVWATGISEGCRVDYTSVAWASYRDNYEIQWQINGTARVDAEGGTGCVEDGASDWSGTETFIVTSSEHPDVSAGCTYTLAVDGKFVEKVGE